jgi:copper chaperone
VRLRLTMPVHRSSSLKEPTVIAFEVQDMTCGHCVRTITQAVQALDPKAQVQIDLTTHRVAIDAAQADAAALGDAIREAGFTPVAASA